MAGHSQFANIKHRKEAQDKKRAKVFLSFSKKIQIAAKSNPDPEKNSTLRNLIAKAKKINMPKTRIESALKNAALKNNDFKSVIYEGYLPNKIAIVVFAETDNVNRTSPEIKHYFSACGGSISTPNSVIFNFNSYFEFSISDNSLKEDDLLDFSIDDYILNETEDQELILITSQEKQAKLTEELEAKNISFFSRKVWKSSEEIKNITDEDRKNINKFITLLDDNDDIDSYAINVDLNNL